MSGHREQQAEYRRLEAERRERLAREEADRRAKKLSRFEVGFFCFLAAAMAVPYGFIAWLVWFIFIR